MEEDEFGGEPLFTVNCPYCGEDVEIYIEPDVHGASLFDFSQKKVLMEEGISATRKAVPKIKELLAKYR